MPWATCCWAAARQSLRSSAISSACPTSIPLPTSVPRRLNETLASGGHRSRFPARDSRRAVRRVYTRYGAEHAGLVLVPYRLRSAVRESRRSICRSQKSNWSPSSLMAARTTCTTKWITCRLRGRKDAPPGASCANWRTRSAEPRHVSQHPGGMIISSRPLIELVLLERRDGGSGRLPAGKDFATMRASSRSISSRSACCRSWRCVELIAPHRRAARLRASTSRPAIYDRICAGDDRALPDRVARRSR